MPTKPGRSNAERLRLVQLAVTNSLSNPTILERVAAYGYDQTRLQAGMDLYQSALAATNTQEAAAGQQQKATQTFNRAWQVALDAYQELSQIARRIFLHDQPALTALELRGSTPRAIAPMLARAYRLFDNALAAEESTRTALEKLGFTTEKIQTGRAKIEALAAADQAQEAAKGRAQQATQAQKRALSLMWDWYGQYRTVARVALREEKQLLEELGIPARTSRTKAEDEALRRRRARPKPTF